MLNIQGDVRSYATILIAAAVVGSVISAVATWTIRRWSTGHAFVDRPAGRKGHAKPVALGGGLAVTLAWILPVLGVVAMASLCHPQGAEWLPAEVAKHLGGLQAKMPMALAITAAAATMCVLGLLDDARPLGPWIKLLVQLAIALYLVVGFDLRMLSHLGWAPSVALSVLWIILLTNSLNFLDNMDGLATGVAIIAAAIFGTTALLAGQLFVPACCWLLVGALVGFLPFNFAPASIYLGDGGSLVIGLLLAILTIMTTFADPTQGHRPIGVFAPLVVMAVPLYDTASVIFLRWRIGVPVWAGDRRHFSHRLVRRGMSVRRAVLVIWLATLVTSLPALLLPRASWPLASGVVVQTLLVITLVALLESSGRAEGVPIDD